MEKAQAYIRIQELREVLREANRQYYVENSPTLSDYEFDLLLKELEALEKEYPEFAKKRNKKKNIDEKNKTHAIITETEERILQVLQFDEPLSIDEVIYRLHGGDVANAAFVLLQLEFKGLVRSDDLHRYVRTVKEGVL